MKRKKTMAGLALAGIVLIALAIPFTAILRNRVPLFSSPGFFSRIRTYLTTNTADTREAERFPELAPARIQGHLPETRERVLQALRELEWELEVSPEKELELHAVVTTPLMGFKDDVRINLEPIDATGTLVNIRSQSRIGKGDFGTNAGHILKLKTALESLH
jgi:uncharacterized protein (DUF1499 family)